MTRRLFVCTNQKSGVGEDVAKALKKELKAQGLKKLLGGGEQQRVRVQTCNCLDLCKQCKKGPGAALVVYPEGTAVWQRAARRCRRAGGRAPGPGPGGKALAA